MLEEMIAAVRQGNADVVLALLESPVVQASFIRDRAAFLSFLAILSSSHQRALLDYVRQALVSDPALVQERYTYGRTLLHEVAGQGVSPLWNFCCTWGLTPTRETSGGTHRCIS